MTTLADLSREHSSLDRDDVDHLHRLGAEWAFLADLCFADLLLYVRSDTGKWLIVDQVRPATNQTIYVTDYIGTWSDVEGSAILDRALEAEGRVEGRIAAKQRFWELAVEKLAKVRGGGEHADYVLPDPAIELMMAKAYGRTGQYEKARQAFEQFVQQYPDSKYVNNAVFWTGETYYKLGDYESAILKYQEVLEKFPKESKAPDALLKMGFALEMMGETQAAIAALERLVREYPLADQVELAKRKVAQLKQKDRPSKKDRGNEVKQRPKKTATEKKPQEKSR